MTNAKFPMMLDAERAKYVAREINYEKEVAELREQVTLLQDAALKAANHVKPTCGDLYEELMQALAATDQKP